MATAMARTTPSKTGMYILPLRFRNYLDLFSLPIGVNACSNTPVINSKRKYKKLAVMAHVLQNNQNSVISRRFLQRTAEKYRDL